MGPRVLLRHICGYSVCLCPIKRTPDLYGLKDLNNFALQINGFVDVTKMVHITLTRLVSYLGPLNSTGVYRGIN